MTQLTRLTAWQNLKQHTQAIHAVTMQELFTADAQRTAKFSLSAAGLQVDYSHNWLTAETRSLLVCLAETVKLPEKIEQLFNGEIVNTTEQRAALHTALRNHSDTAVYYQQQNIMPCIHHCLVTMTKVSEQLRTRHWLGHTQKPITDVVHIGLGGSYLGPALTCQALATDTPSPIKLHFLADIDQTHVRQILAPLNPETTLFIIASKSFTTSETMLNAQFAKQWLGCDPTHHLIAITHNTTAALQFGVAQHNIFPIWDWIGGRYSLWSAMGLPLMIQIGAQGFHELLAGAFAMDQHVRTAPLAKNIPVLLALLSVWYINFFGATTHAIIPYLNQLALLPSYAQQLDMESNGKQVTIDNEAVDYATGAIIWGQVGCQAQHSFFQLLHQGTHLIPIDFIVQTTCADAAARHLFANAMGQRQALLHGNRNNDYQRIPGNRPNNLLTMEQLNPFTLGALLALYEHKVFAQSVIWNINPFDQPGVELGKQLARQFVDSTEQPDTTPSSLLE